MLDIIISPSSFHYFVYAFYFQHALFIVPFIDLVTVGYLHCKTIDFNVRHPLKRLILWSPLGCSVNAKTFLWWYLSCFFIKASFTAERKFRNKTGHKLGHTSAKDNKLGARGQHCILLIWWQLVLIFSWGGQSINCLYACHQFVDRLFLS